MSIPSYSSYQSTEDQFVRKYPAHWAFKRSDGMLSTSRRVVQPSEMDGQTVFHFSIPALQETGNGRLEDGSTIDSAKTLVDTRCVLVSKLNPRKGVVCIADQVESYLTVCSGELIPLHPRSISVEYIHYLVQSATYRDRLASRVESATRSHQRASVDDVLKFYWAFPPAFEEMAIVKFLDRETSKIDSLISDMVPDTLSGDLVRLSSLLRERRTALITAAVTGQIDVRGLVETAA